MNATLANPIRLGRGTLKDMSGLMQWVLDAPSATHHQS
jgi:hypothetical protein